MDVIKCFKTANLYVGNVDILQIMILSYNILLDSLHYAKSALT